MRARAFWLREPGAGEIRDVALPTPRPDDVRRPHAALRGEPRDREPGLRRPGAGEPARRDAGAVPGRRLPRAGEVRLPQRGRGRGGPGRPARSHGLLPAPAPDGVRRPGRRRSCRCPTACPSARAVLAGIVETAVNALWDARPLLGDRVAVVGAGVLGLQRGAAAVARARHLGDPGRRRSVPGRRWPPRSAWTSRCRTTRRPGRDLVVHTSATSAGLQRSPGPARARGHGARAQLVRRRADDACRSGALPLRAARRPCQPGGPGGCPRGVTPYDGASGSPSPSTCSATRPSTAC